MKLALLTVTFTVDNGLGLLPEVQAVITMRNIAAKTTNNFFITVLPPERICNKLWDNFNFLRPEKNCVDCCAYFFLNNLSKFMSRKKFTNSNGNPQHQNFSKSLFVDEIEQSIPVTKHLHYTVYISLTYKTVLLILHSIISQCLIKYYCKGGINAVPASFFTNHH
jgi:hypothetical protein